MEETGGHGLGSRSNTEWGIASKVASCQKKRNTKNRKVQWGVSSALVVQLHDTTGGARQACPTCCQLLEVPS